MLTCGKTVLDPEANPLQLIVAEEADPHESPTGEDQPGTDRAAEAVDERREAERAVPHLDVVEATLKGSLDEEFLIKQQLDPLTWQGWGEHGSVRSAAKEVIAGNIYTAQNCAENTFFFPIFHLVLWIF